MPDEWVLLSEYERAQYFQNFLIAFSTGGGGTDSEYQALRKYFLDNPGLAKLLPGWVRTNRDIGQLWQFIKHAYGSYAERRIFIWGEFTHLLEHLEDRDKKPSDEHISERLKSFDPDGIHAIWSKTLERRSSDPEGAITMARTLLETVCKYVLDAQQVKYDADKVDLPDLYRLVSQELNLAPSQHTQDTFKKILGGVTSVVNELGSLRNRLGDAHGQGKRPIKPAARHAELAVNLAGSISLFLVETYLTLLQQQENK